MSSALLIRFISGGKQTGRYRTVTSGARIAKWPLRVGLSIVLSRPNDSMRYPARRRGWAIQNRSVAVLGPMLLLLLQLVKHAIPTGLSDRLFQLMGAATYLTHLCRDSTAAPVNCSYSSVYLQSSAHLRGMFDKLSTLQAQKPVILYLNSERGFSGSTKICLCMVNF